MTLSAIVLFAATELVLSLSPGPAVMLVVSQGIRLGARASRLGALGVIAGDLFHFTLSALGVGALLLTSETLFMGVRWVGALYLAFLGMRLILRSPGRHRPYSGFAPHAPDARLFRQGLLMQLVNPKAILFFTALLPQFIRPGSPPLPQFLLLGLVSVSIQFPTLVLYGWLAARGGERFRHSRFRKWLDRVCGALLISAGGRIALSGDS